MTETTLALLGSFSPRMQAAIGLAGLLLLSYAAQAVAQYLLLHMVPRIRERMDVRWAARPRARAPSRATCSWASWR